MFVKRLVSEQLDRAGRLGNRARAFCQDGLETALSLGKDRVSDLFQAAEKMEPNIKSSIDEGVRFTQKIFDQLNQALAERAIPNFRRAGVTQKRLEEKSNGVRAVATEQPSQKERGGGGTARKSAPMPRAVSEATAGETKPVKARVRTAAIVSDGKQESVSKRAKSAKSKSVKTKSKSAKPAG